jgi:predicted dehydrogenase
VSVSGITKIAVIGAGYWGPNLIRNFKNLSDSKVVLVCDLDQDRLDHVSSLFPGVGTTRDWHEVIASDVDAVCIATPVPWHFEMARAVIESGKHVFVEKPLTADVCQARELVDSAAKRDLILLVDHTFVYSPAVNRIREIVSSGEIGDVYYVSMSRLNLGLFQKDINVVWDLAPHDISILTYVLGSQPVQVSAQGNSNILPGIEDVAMLTLYFPDNVIAYVHVSWLDPSKVRKSTFVGSKKMLVYDDVEPLEKIKIYDKGVDGPRHYDTFGDFQFSYRYGDIHTPFLASTEPLQVECRHFLECIAGRETPRSGGPAGLAVVQIIEAAQRSLKNGGSLEPII